MYGGFVIIIQFKLSGKDGRNGIIICTFGGMKYLIMLSIIFVSSCIGEVSREEQFIELVPTIPVPVDSTRSNKPHIRPWEPGDEGETEAMPWV